MESNIQQFFSCSSAHSDLWKIMEQAIDARSYTTNTNYNGIENFPSKPISFSEYWKNLQDTILPHTVNVRHPKFIGHMTSSIPNFFQELARFVTMINQNVVKTETSDILTFIERKSLEYIHNKVYQKDTDFYSNISTNGNYALGTVTSNGSLSNTMAMWIARNRVLESAEFSCESDGISACLAHKKYKHAVIICSTLAHYSIKKIASLIGIGTKNIIAIDVDDRGQILLNDLEQELLQCKKNKVCVIALWAVAGSTELGSIDPLEEMAQLAEKYNTHFHVDAAWGGIFALTKYAQLLKGIEKADTVTMCGHKQFYLPQGISIILAKKPDYMRKVETQARYQARSHSFDLGRWSLEGSRPANSLFLHAAFYCIGCDGYQLLVNHSFELRKYFVQKINASQEFELVTQPYTNIVTYRYIPHLLRNKAFHDEKQHNIINEINKSLQKKQWQQGHSFVSQTTVNLPQYQLRNTVILRTALINPNTNKEDLDSILSEQLHLVSSIEKEAKYL
ncbi:aminotransferase class V-fold PLP-dependent enzyme [Candidatus Uabimicrobium sp. HlEnr_7]|uniref:aminotransferase class V-fold PLP-dependent enzyme n=1 Tax=Candidatus Uabimicrobium helgolandensis TaxID=3095367 RepID=UPI003557F2B9